LNVYTHLTLYVLHGVMYYPYILLLLMALSKVACSALFSFVSV